MPPTVAVMQSFIAVLNNSSNPLITSDALKNRCAVVVNLFVLPPIVFWTLWYALPYQNMCTSYYNEYIMKGGTFHLVPGPNWAGVTHVLPAISTECK